MVAKFILDTTIKGDTEIYFSESVYYPYGYKVSILIDNRNPEHIHVDSSVKNYLKFRINDSKYNGKTVSLVLTPNVLNRQNIYKCSNDHYKMIYHVSDLKHDQKGMIFYSIKGLPTLPKGSHFEILNAVDNKKICSSGRLEDQTCIAYNYQGYHVKVNLYKEGYLWNSSLLSAEISKLNGNMVEI